MHSKLVHGVWISSLLSCLYVYFLNHKVGILQLHEKYIGMKRNADYPSSTVYALLNGGPAPPSIRWGVLTVKIVDLVIFNCSTLISKPKLEAMSSI